MKVIRSFHLFAAAFTALCFAAIAETPKPVAGELPVEVQLIWGTNDESSPNPKHKQVEPDLAKKLGDSFKWKKYFEEERKTANIPAKGSKKLKLSPNCEIEVTNLGDDKIEIKLFGEGKPVVKNKGSLAGGELVVIGGDAKNDTAWFVTVRKKK